MSNCRANGENPRQMGPMLRSIVHREGPNGQFRVEIAILWRARADACCRVQRGGDIAGRVAGTRVFVLGKPRGGSQGPPRLSARGSAWPRSRCCSPSTHRAIGNGSFAADPATTDRESDRGMYPAFALDHMEPMRPVVDRAVLQLIQENTFAGADFSIQHDGVCRLNPELARRVADVCLRYYALVGGTKLSEAN